MTQGDIEPAGGTMKELIRTPYGALSEASETEWVVTVGDAEARLGDLVETTRFEDLEEAVRLLNEISNEGVPEDGNASPDGYAIEFLVDPKLVLTFGGDEGDEQHDDWDTLFSGSTQPWVFVEDDWVPWGLQPEKYGAPNCRYADDSFEGGFGVTAQLYESRGYYGMFVSSPEEGVVSGTGYSILGQIPSARAIEIAKSVVQESADVEDEIYEGNDAIGMTNLAEADQFEVPADAIAWEHWSLYWEYINREEVGEATIYLSPTAEGIEWLVTGANDSWVVGKYKTLKKAVAAQKYYGELIAECDPLFDEDNPYENRDNDFVGLANLAVSDQFDIPEDSITWETWRASLVCKQRGEPTIEVLTGDVVIHYWDSPDGPLWLITDDEETRVVGCHDSLDATVAARKISPIHNIDVDPISFDARSDCKSRAVNYVAKKPKPRAKPNSSADIGTYMCCPAHGPRR